VAGDLLDRPIGRAVLSLAWPTILAGLLENAATTVDMIMVGRLGAAEIASVGFCAMINWALFTPLMGLSVAVVAIVARNVGAGRSDQAHLALGQGLLLAVFTGILTGLATFLAAPLIFRAFGLEPRIYEMSLGYLRLLCLGQPFFGVLMVCGGALRGSGDMRTPLYLGAAANVMHVGFNYVLIFGRFGLPALGVRGAATGTVLSFFIDAVVLILLLHSPWFRLRLSLRDFIWNKERALTIVRLAVPACAEQLVLQIGLLFYARFIVAFGTAALSGYQVGMQVLSLSFIPNMGFSIAAGTLVGQNLGAGRPAQAKRTGWVCLSWSLGALSLMGVVYLTAARPIAGIFVREPEVIGYAVSFIWAVAFVQPGMAIYFTLAGALRGAGDTRTPLLVTLLGMYGCRIPVTWIVTGLMGWGASGVFYLLILDYAARVAAILTRYKRGRWLTIRL